MIGDLRKTIRQELRNRKLSMRSVSIDAGIHADTLGKFMSGKSRSMRVDSLEAICMAIGFSLELAKSNEAA